MKIGVFDSGIGGLSVAQAIEKVFPHAMVLFVNDVDHLPYGSKQPIELERLTRPHLQYLVDQGCDVIVVACNTVSTTVLSSLKDEFTVPIIGVVPMVREASEVTQRGVIAVCATPTTLASSVYGELKQRYASQVQVIEPYCGDWAQLIESKSMDKAKVQATVEEVCRLGADVIVLGCTHYHWIEDSIVAAAEGRATVLQPEQKVIAELMQVLGQQR